MKDYRLFIFTISVFFLGILDLVLQSGAFSFHLLASSLAILLCMRSTWIEYICLCLIYFLFSLYVANLGFILIIIFSLFSVELSNTFLKRNSFYCYVLSSLFTLVFAIIVHKGAIHPSNVFVSVILSLGFYYLHRHNHGKSLQSTTRSLKLRA